MLDIADTGYEGKFDFADVGQQPEMVYMLATVPRSGSTYLSHLLWQTGCLGAPLEYLNFDPNGHYFFASHSPQVQLDLWQRVLRRRTSPNGVFGVKCFLPQLQALQEGNPALLSVLRPRRIIYLERRDRIAHAVSLARAHLSGVWNARQEGQGREPQYSQQVIADAEEGIAAQGDGWEERFRSLGIEPLRLWYEEVVASPSEAAQQVAAYLGVSISPDAQVRVPDVVKQSGSEARSWAERYAKSKAALGSS